MRYAHFAPLGRDLSRLVLGTALYERAPLDTSSELLDAWVALGGNAIDTGRQYGNAEPIVGGWLRDRGLAEEIVVITKGGHYDEETGRPRVTRADLTEDLERSREALGLDSVPLFLLHRDDPARPVSEILDELKALHQAGGMKAFGASNWTVDRLDEARRHALTNGLTPFSCSSPNFSLAVANEEPWPGCVSMHDDDSRAWHESTQLPVFAWSSLAGGFFAGASDADVDRVYHSTANLERLRRARLLGHERGATPSQVALAWLLHQPFPVFAIIGPQSVAELEESVEALELILTDEELRWIDLDEAAGAHEPPETATPPAGATR